MLGAIIVLPGTVAIFVPAALVWFSRDSQLAASPSNFMQPAFWIGILAITTGIGLAIWTTRLFLTVGEGTPAPWNPPRKFVVLGPYRYVRNPMIIGVLFILVGEALLLHSALIAAWMVVFFLLNAIYFPAIEEKDLERRFGNPYREYMKNVRRWIPRLSPWIET